jgi:hypothetical protein
VAQRAGFAVPVIAAPHTVVALADAIGRHINQEVA